MEPTHEKKMMRAELVDRALPRGAGVMYMTSIHTGRSNLVAPKEVDEPAD